MTCYNQEEKYYYKAVIEMAKRTEKKVFEEHIVSQETGEIITSKTVYNTQTEPEYVKLYIDCLFAVKGVRKEIGRAWCRERV